MHLYRSNNFWKATWSVSMTSLSWGMSIGPEAFLGMPSASERRFWARTYLKKALYRTRPFWWGMWQILLVAKLYWRHYITCFTVIFFILLSKHVFILFILCPLFQWFNFYLLLMIKLFRLIISTGWNDKIVVLKKTTQQFYFKTFIEKISSANLIM